jgi:hypothetical protein
MRTDRNPAQRAPRWIQPPGADAAAALELAFGKSARRYIVFCVKSSGTLTKFQAYDTLAEAEAVANQLRAVGCDCTVRATP